SDTARIFTLCLGPAPGRELAGHHPGEREVSVQPSEDGSLRSWGANRRNHYRTLHVQPDAPVEAIRASYRTLMQSLKLHPDLGGDHWTAVHVNAAYAVLTDPVRRAAYDRELLAHYDIATVSRGPVQPAGRSSWGRTCAVPPGTALDTVRGGHREDAIVSSTARLQTRSGVGTYEAAIARSCLFCTAPHLASAWALEEARCTECASPLHPPRADFVNQARRSLGRSPHSEKIAFYTCWPGSRLSGHLLDLSPTGLRFATAEACEVGDVLKIDARTVQAVGVVAHQHRHGSSTIAGVRFHAVDFAVRRGSFVSARA
ncbi:MAG: DnaJ domain-containing protein, partial [Acidobacteriota bacterium]|nr:DnaJ domain-containing protein [Acidobacteriota bacterium]